MTKMNCWEFKKCERHPGGAKTSELGICPAATETRANTVNGGTNAGRACWAVAGTFCGGKTQGTSAQKMENCLKCEFYQLVFKEEDAGFMKLAGILEKVRS